MIDATSTAQQWQSGKYGDYYSWTIWTFNYENLRFIRILEGVVIARELSEITGI